ncbi:MBL fold metallo-hydrolase [Proteiniclasticum sp. QWL-01]|uniref:MBL fold metallo-hydrolase n=1 Tax=Proteiniclasticum sp. QWL-01 TaxID=3036945 RepID=UPI0021FF19D6|nr:MBL fold metallo-hydrolase [Proteiniclasticum sp. QWL-01]UUM11515.1 MBL fold metallo-hydrolase [Clostridiaceae bacterium HFYG-1003]WFF72967.1 MBL fold metallo-hydrolase [Proteiniclasticum sp. QWL-01]
MDVKNVGSRGTMVTYQDLVDTEFGCTTNIYVIKGREGSIVIDTFLGEQIMAETMVTLERDPNSVWAVINTHSDWDHIWGNSLFRNAHVIAHDNFSDQVEFPDSPGFQELEKYAMGEVDIKLPDITFDSRLHLSGEGLELFHSPGHSVDSITIYDEKDRILIAGDNCEKPIPSYVNPFLLEEHLASLKQYLTYDFEAIIPGHGEMMTRTDLLTNIQYIQDLIEGDESKLKAYETGPCKMNHLTNQLYMESLKD